MLKENLPPSYFQSPTPGFRKQVKMEPTGILLMDELDTFETPKPVSKQTLEPYKKKFANTTYYTTKQDDLQKASGLTEERTPFKALFYSRSNLECIQKMLKYAMRIAGYTISDQDETQILQIMRVIEKWYSYNPTCPTKFVDETIKLNNMIVEYSVPRMVNNIEQRKGFLRDFNNPHNRILPLPINLSVKGEDNKVKDISSYMI